MRPQRHVAGGSADKSLKDVWSSQDGHTWALMTAEASWSARFSAGLHSFNGRLWLVGCNNLRDTWFGGAGSAAIGGYYPYRRP
jgi:hypothetical protein